MDSLYAKYKQELEDSNISYIPGVGFGVWSMHEENSIYVQDVYVTPKERGKTQCFNILRECVGDAKDKDINVKNILTSVDTNINTINESLKVITKLGFDYYGSEGDTLYFIKEIR
tara:strand:+ start:2347 stop:2691 length:345 start_codon:yes stop_codon:yes gene_type:complete